MADRPCCPCSRAASRRRPVLPAQPHLPVLLAHARAATELPVLLEQPITRLSCSRAGQPSRESAALAQMPCQLSPPHHAVYRPRAAARVLRPCSYRGLFSSYSLLPFYHNQTPFDPALDSTRSLRPAPALVHRRQRCGVRWKASLNRRRLISTPEIAPKDVEVELVSHHGQVGISSLAAAALPPCRVAGLAASEPCHHAGRLAALRSKHTHVKRAARRPRGSRSRRSSRAWS
jgi:hypothetical protein